MPNQALLNFLTPLLLALFLGSLVGLERQWHRRLVDLKTNSLVCMGAALFMMVSVRPGSDGAAYVEPIRMAAQIVVGVGFIGGGLLLRDGNKTIGINTAATLWCCAAVGTLCGLGLMDLYASMGLLTVAAVAGNQSNYAIGRFIGPKVFQWEQSRLFNKKAFEQAHAFYEQYGGIAVVLARFMPFLRTFAPFVAGVSAMSRGKFTLYDVSGGALWVTSVTLAGYFFGNIPFVKTHLDKIIWSMILIPGVLTLVGSWRASRKAKQASSAA